MNLLLKSILNSLFLNMKNKFALEELSGSI